MIIFWNFRVGVSVIFLEPIDRDTHHTQIYDTNEVRRWLRVYRIVIRLNVP